MKHIFAGVAAFGLLTLVSGSSFAYDEYERWLRIHNKTGVDLCEVYISHVGTGDWQEDRIGSCIGPGKYRTIDPGYQEGYCRMDLKFVFADGDVVFENSLNICEEEDLYIND